MKINLIIGFLVTLSLPSLIGCGTKVGTGAVNVQFTNNTAAAIIQEMEAGGVLGFVEDFDLRSALLGITPTIYQMKLVVFYLVENIDQSENNVGSVARIWTSNRCDADLTYCGINPANSGSYVVDYFDLARGSSAVNADFQAYTRDTKESQVSAGTYRYLRMDFTGKVFSDSDTTPNLKFGTSTANEVRAQTGSIKVTLAEPLVIAQGETFTVNLAYDLQKRFYQSGTYAQPPSEVSSSQKWTCNGTGSGIPCIVEAEFSPTVTKN